jgi:hypothetical protein
LDSKLNPRGGRLTLEGKVNPFLMPYVVTQSISLLLSFSQSISLSLLREMSCWHEEEEEEEEILVF